MLIGILQTGHAPEPLRARHGDYDQMFDRLLAGRGLSFASWDVEHMQFPPDVHAADGWLITGSRHGAYDDLPFIAPLETFIREARDAGVPMVGICFGHQIMAQALGARVEKFDGGWAVGPQDYDFGDTRLTLNAWHQDQIVTPPESAELIASSDFCRYAAFSYGDWGLSVQPHPEFNDAFLQGLIETRGKGLVPQEQLEAASARLGTPVQADAIAARIADFFAKKRG